MAFFEGKKTYIAALITGLVAAADVLGYHPPEGLLIALGAFGLYGIRSAIGRAS